MSRFVRDDGSKSARLVLIGDQPDRHAEGQGRPFVGWHSQQMAGWWQTNGLSRRDFYLSYFYPYRFPLLAAKGFPKDDHRVWTDDLHDRIAALHDPWLIVPTGNTALKALTGKWGITRHRGSIYEYIDRRGRRIKVIPALDSSTVAKMPAWERRCVADWRRIEGDSHFRDLRTPEREHFIRPTLRDVRDYLEDVRARAECLSVDIETPRSLTFESYRSKPTKKFPEGKPRSRKVIGRARITCIGFSHDPGFGFVIPTTESYWGSEQTLEDVWELIRELLATKAKKLYQNGFFDNWWLTQPEYAAPSLNWVWDTKCVTGDVEVLTPQGWQRFDTLPDDIEAAQWHENGIISWCKPTVRRMHFASNLYHTKNALHDCRYTPEHRIPVVWQSNRKLVVRSMTNATKLKSVYLPVAGQMVDGTQRPSWLRLLVAIQADGHILPGDGGVTFEFKKVRKLRRLLDLCGDDEEIRVYKRGTRATTHLRLRGPRIKAACDLLGQPKRFGAWILDLTSLALKEFVNETQYWDASQYKGYFVYVSKHKENAEWVATAAHLSGRAANMMQSPNSMWMVTVKNRDVITMCWAANTKVERYDGTVYCLTTQSGFFLARSNGKIFVTGNCMHQALDITDTHSLQYMASVDTREPYWKDEAKDPDEIMKYASDLDAFHTYNSIDVTVQRELGDVYAARLAADGRLQWYMRHFAEMFGPILRMSRRGVLLDEERRKRRHALLTVACMRIKQRLEEIAGAPLHGPKDLVPKKVAWYLYEQMRLPRQLDRKSGKPTTKEVVIRKLMLRFPDKMGKSDIDAAGTMKPTELKDAILAETKPGPLILAHRRKFKLSSFLREGIPDADHRVRSAYAFVSTLRLSSSKNPARTGQNNQNIDREIRDCYLPDPGLFFGETDCSQGESRIVYCLSGDPELVEIAKTQPWEFDDHNRTAGIVFTCPSKGIWPNGMKMFDVTPDQRYFGKRTRHASNYGMHGNKMSEELLKEGIIRDPDECDRWIDALLQRDKAILYWQTNVRKKVLRDRCIGNSWGHVIDFTWERLGDDLYRKAYAAQPQSELGMLLNQYGFKVLDGEIQKHKMRTRINMQNHDALLYSTCLEECYDVMTLLQTSLAQPRVYNGVKLSMPVENKVGINWKADKKIGEGMEFKRLPDRDEFNAKVREFLARHATKS